jgi:hypothetical protein
LEERRTAGTTEDDDNDDDDDDERIEEDPIAIEPTPNTQDSEVEPPGASGRGPPCTVIEA